jgi:hypothetical protein
LRQKSPVPFAAWEPDKALISGVAGSAKGVISLGGRYAPHRDLLPLSAGISINSDGLGGAGYYDANGAVRIFIGDAGHLYEVQSRIPVDISRVGGYSVNSDWAWVFEQFGASILATARGLNQIQYFTLGSSIRFNDVTTGPGQSDTLFRVREFMFSGKGRTLKNSVFNNFTDWNPLSPTGVQAGEFDLPFDGGDIVIGTGGQFGIVFQERKVHRLTYSGASGPAFHRDEIEDKRGALGPNAITRYGQMTFFASEDRVTDGNESQGIGEGKIDRYFAAQLNYSQRHKVCMAVDVESRVLKIAFPSGGSKTCDKILIYSMADGRWSWDDIPVQLLFEAPKQGVTIDDTPAVTALAGTNVVDNIDIPVDSPVWRESRKQIMAVDASRQIGTFEGPNRAAIIETGLAEVLPGQKGYVSEVWPLVDAVQCTASIDTRHARLSDATNSTTLSAMNRHGFCPLRREARWIRARVQIPAGATWTEASGLDWDAEAAGEL